MEYIEIAKSHIQYHVKLKDYVKSLKRTRDVLNNKIEDVRQQLEIDRRCSGKVPRKEVENWLNYGKQMIEEAQHVENEVNNWRYFFRAFYAKRVEEKTQEMEDILNKGPCVSESLVIDGRSVGFPLPTSELIGETVVRDQIWSWLMQEEVFRIGVWGMGGVGKTTIMKNIHNALLKANRFSKVIWVTISKEFNILKIQDDIARTLNGNMPKEEDRVRRAELLMNMLGNAKNHVLILDDVWDKISLKEVGIPEPTSSNGSKLVLTTRKEEVCKFMGCKVIKVNPLSEEEALILFLNKVGPNIWQIPASTLRDVVKECAGLPSTITMVAGTLKGVDDSCIWNDALIDLKGRIGKVVEMEAGVNEGFKFSFDHLKDKNVQQCFLYCALYPEDFAIEEDGLIECWIDEGFIAEMDTRQQMKDKGHAILEKLKDNCLLESVEMWAVKMHDAVRDMALSITSMEPRYMVKAGMQLKWFPQEEEWTMDLEKVSFMRNSISEIPIDLSAPKCRLLTTLLLQENPIKKISNSFFANMPCLSVLNLSQTEIECLPTSLSELKNLTALLLQGCQRLKHLPSLSKLQRLEKLDLCYSRIEEVPEGMEMLVNLRYLNFDMVYTLKEVPTGLLLKLSRLQYLRFNLFDGKTSINAEEVVPLEKLESFFGRFKDMHEFKKFVQSMQCKKSLNAYWLQVGPPGGVSYEESKVVSILAPESCGDDVLLPFDVQRFDVSNCSLFRSLSNISSLKYANDLRKCFIGYCQGMEFVLPFSSSSTSCTPFQSLESLTLRDLPRLSELIRTEGFTSGPSILAPPGIFSHLKFIYIRECSNIKKLFPHWLLTSLQNVEAIQVEVCKQLVEIFAVATSEDGDEEKGSDKIKVNLPKLRRLELMALPELKSICSKSGVMVCDSLEKISVRSCPKLKRTPPVVSLLGNEQQYAYAPPGIFSHLKFIHIHGCSNIKKLFLHWLLTNLQNLEEILVERCEQLVEIFAVSTSEDDDEEKGSDKIKISLPKLKWLTLISLPELKSICSKSGVMVCDSLEEISVSYCPKLNRIPPLVSLLGNEQPYAYAPPGIFSHLKEIHIWDCSSIKKLFLHWLLTGLQNAEEILVERCGQLVEIFAVSTSEDDDEEKGSDKIKVSLPKLRRLELISLPELKSICSKSGVMVCDSLEVILIEDCSKLKRIPPFLSLLGDGQPYAYAPPSLKIESSKEWWDSLEWDHPNFKNVLQPLCQLGESCTSDEEDASDINEADST